MKSDYQTMQQVLERSRVLNDRLCELGLDMPPLPVTLEELEAYREREYAELCFYRETLDAPDLMLYDAYEAKHLAGMQEALAAGANPDLRICWEGEPLAADAVRCGWAAGAGFLLEAGADPLAEEGDLLFLLCRMGPAHVLQKALQQPGVSPDFDDGCDSLAVWAAEAGQVECLRVLRAAGADLLPEDGKVLCKACAANQPEAVRYLLEECGAPVNTDYDDWTPLDYAASHDSLECARLLLEAGADPEFRDIVGRTPISRASNAAMKQLLDGYCR